MSVDLEVQIVLPPKSEDAVSWMLEAITEELAKRDADSIAHGFLGGEFGYGGHWDSATFEMRPFYWGDCTCGFDERETAWCADHRHGTFCYQSVLRQLRKDAGLAYWNGEQYVDGVERSYDESRKIEERIYRKLCKQFGLTYPNGCAVHCTCDYEPTWKVWIAENGHSTDCLLTLPNFRHKASGLEVRWYKYIGRGMEVKGSANLQQVLDECLADIRSTQPLAAGEKGD